jgi:hypothetical protein
MSSDRPRRYGPRSRLKSLAATQVKGRIGPTAVSPFGDQSEYPVVNAIVSGGRVTALAGWIGAAGE